jgi:hypothetical protein
MMKCRRLKLKSTGTGRDWSKNMIKKGFIILWVGMLALLALVGCGSDTGAASDPATSGTVAQTDTETISIADVIGEESATAVPAAAPTSAAAALAETAANEPATDAVVDTTGAVLIALDGDTIAVEGDGVAIDGATATITAAGTYSLSGALADGQIIVDTADEDPVQIILNGVDIRSSASAPLAFMNAAQVVIILADDTANYVEDAPAYIFLDAAEEEPSAAIFSNDDLTITGNGSLTVAANYNDAISSDDSVTIAGGTVTVTAVDDGIRGKDFLTIHDGTITVEAGGDGLKSDNEDDAELGYIAIEGGTIAVTAGGDAIQAETDVLVTGGEFALVSGGGSAAQIGADDSAKGIKGVANVLIDGGTFTIDAADDAIHSNGNITINGGVFVLSTGDDGIHADATVTVNGGDIDITRSYEGIESAVITFNDGDISVIAADDGINVAGGVDGSGAMPGPGRGRGGPGAAQGSETFTYTGDYYLYVNGGTIVVDAAGDGLDANGAIEMTGGVVVVNGPTESMNGALDYDGTFNISGGYLVAVGSAGMAQAPGAASTQNSVLINLNDTLPGGTLVNIQNEAGKSLLTFAPSKEIQSITFSSPELATGEYTLYYGGRADGTSDDGLYTDGTYAAGTEYTAFTISSVTTILGQGGFR